MFTCREGMLENCKTVKTVAPFECNDLIGELPKDESVAWSKIKFVWKVDHGYLELRKCCFACR